jgi:colanic acid/amylovoran biosynthesis glycosyltransferase
LSQSSTIAYLASEYPALSHTFIEREIRALRESGHKVCTASIRKPSAAHVQRMNEREHREIEQTLYIKHRLVCSNASSIAFEFLTHPVLCLETLLSSLSLSRRGYRSGCKAIGYTLEALVLRRWLRQRHAKHLHVHFANPAATVALLAVKGLGCHLSISVHGPDIFDNVRGNNLVDKFRAAQRIRVISNYCKSQVCRWMNSDEWDKCHRIRCGISTGVFSPRPNPGNLVPNLLCLGRLVPAKGQHVLLDAAALLRDAGTAFHLTIVGDGPDRQSLERRAIELGLAESVEFTGAVGQDEVHRYYDCADIFVLSSFAEGVPVVLMEAMAKEIPVISTRITGIPELIEHGRSGLLVSASDAQSLADAIQRLIHDPELRKRLGAEGREKILDEYDLDKNIQGMIEFFDCASKV